MAAAAADPVAAMSEAEVRAAAEAEGLTLLPANNATGFQGVSVERCRFKALGWVEGKRRHLGIFVTAVEAALSADLMLSVKLASENVKELAPLKTNSSCFCRPNLHFYC